MMAADMPAPRQKRRWFTRWDAMEIGAMAVAGMIVYRFAQPLLKVGVPEWVVLFVAWVAVSALRKRLERTDGAAPR